MRFDKRYGLLLFAIGLWVWIGYSISSHSTKRIIKATIIQSAKPIRKLDDKIYPVKKEILWLDKLFFPRGNVLYHPVYGNLGYRSNFIILFDADFELKQDANVTFVVYSDDGFRFKVDGKRVMEFVKDRPYSKDERTMQLKAGKHHLFLKYFQEYGQLGLSGFYSLKGEKLHFIGENSKNIIFLKQ